MKLNMYSLLYYLITITFCNTKRIQNRIFIT